MIALLGLVQAVIREEAVDLVADDERERARRSGAGLVLRRERDRIAARRNGRAVVLAVDGEDAAPVLGGHEPLGEPLDVRHDRKGSGQFRRAGRIEGLRIHIERGHRQEIPFGPLLDVHGTVEHDRPTRTFVPG